MLTTHLENPYGYGRVVKREAGRLIRIVEEKDASAEEREITEVNSGIYCVDAEFLFNALTGLKCDNAISSECTVRPYLRSPTIVT